MVFHHLRGDWVFVKTSLFLTKQTVSLRVGFTYLALTWQLTRDQSRVHRMWASCLRSKPSLHQEMNVYPFCGTHGWLWLTHNIQPARTDAGSNLKMIVSRSNVTPGQIRYYTTNYIPINLLQQYFPTSTQVRNNLCHTLDYQGSSWNPVVAGGLLCTIEWQRYEESLRRPNKKKKNYIFIKRPFCVAIGNVELVRFSSLGTCAWKQQAWIRQDTEEEGKKWRVNIERSTAGTKNASPNGLIVARVYRLPGIATHPSRGWIT